MGVIAGKHVPRRTMLRGLGATIALPLLDAMIPARAQWNAVARAAGIDRTRLVATMPMSAMNGGTPAPLMTVAFLTST